MDTLIKNILESIKRADKYQKAEMLKSMGIDGMSNPQEIERGVREFVTLRDEPINLAAGDDEESIEESAMIAEMDILSEAQKAELTKIIDGLVEERADIRTKQMMKKFTKFITESVGKKIVAKTKSDLVSRIDEELNAINDKSARVCRSVVTEAAEEVRLAKESKEQLIEEFQKKAPVVMEQEIDKRVKQLTEEARQKIEEAKANKELYENIIDGFKKVGYVINEDVNGVIGKKDSENLELKTELTKIKTTAKIQELTEGMLPKQKERAMELLEDCTSAEQVERNFKDIRMKVIRENNFVEEKEEEKIDPKTQAIFNEEDEFSKLVSASKRYYG